MSQAHHISDPFLKKISRFEHIAEESRLIISSLKVSEEYGPGQTLRASAHTYRPLILAEGWVVRYRLLTDGRRQIVGILLAGDHLGLDTVREHDLDIPMTTVTQVKFLNATPLKEALESPGTTHSRLRSALGKADLRTRGRLVDNLVRMGRQNGYERSASLICELEDRLSAAGMAERGAFALPLTQELLADTLGMSVVHVNRTLQQLRGERLIEFHGGTLKILKGALLASIGDYEKN